MGWAVQLFLAACEEHFNIPFNTIYIYIGGVLNFFPKNTLILGVFSAPVLLYDLFYLNIYGLTP